STCRSARTIALPRRCQRHRSRAVSIGPYRSESVRTDFEVSVRPRWETHVCHGLPQRGGTTAGSIKMFFSWPESTWPAVRWVREARWVEDGKFWTSSGVAAGIDMALAVVARLAGQQTADFLANATEYDWHRDVSWDPFARVHGLV